MIYKSCQNIYHTTKYSPSTLLSFSLAVASASRTLLLPSSSCCLTDARLELRALSSILCCWSSLAFCSRKDCSALCPDACLSESTSVVFVQCLDQYQGSQSQFNQATSPNQHQKCKEHTCMPHSSSFSVYPHLLNNTGGFYKSQPTVHYYSMEASSHPHTTQKHITSFPSRVLIWASSRVFSESWSRFICIISDRTQYHTSTYNKVALTIKRPYSTSRISINHTSLIRHCGYYFRAASILMATWQVSTASG